MPTIITVIKQFTLYSLIFYLHGSTTYTFHKEPHLQTSDFDYDKQLDETTPFI